ncbi:MAG: SLAC1 anion channel family protein, partial [Pseudomonadota bacterium]|nr:SLAC1 anion channel family protein [Pseudomonadota bacterium]
KFQINHINPAWFIPVVGNILVPIAGVPLGYPEISWFFFSIGIVFWLVLLTIFFNRIIFHDPMPQRLVPTFFILIAPPAVAFIAWFKLGGELDAFARVLYYTALFFSLLLATQIGKFARLPFFLSWWAYSFPLAALTVATMLMYQELQTPWFKWLSILLLALVTLVILMLVVKTVAAISSRGICIEEG